MNVKAFCVVTAAALFALSANAQQQQHSAGDGSASSRVPSSSQAYPPGSTATPSGHSPGQGAGTSGSATADFHRGAMPGMGHGGSAGGTAMDFSQMDRNNDGQISRDEWNAMRGSSAGASQPSTTEPSSHAPAQ